MTCCVWLQLSVMCLQNFQKLSTQQMAKQKQVQLWRHSSYRDMCVYLTGPICSLRKPSEELQGPYRRSGGQSRSPVSSIIIPPSSADSTSDVRRLSIPPGCKPQFVELLGTSPLRKISFFFSNFFFRSAIFALCSVIQHVTDGLSAIRPGNLLGNTNHDPGRKQLVGYNFILLNICIFKQKRSRENIFQSDSKHSANCNCISLSVQI